MKKEISWTTPSRIFIPKTVDWYWIVSIIAVTISIISIILNNIIFAILTIIATFVSFLNAHKIPKNIDIIINTKGIKVDNKIYFYNEIESFWIEDGNLHPRIILKSKSLLSPLITILLHEEDVDEVREYLRDHLNEEYLNEHLLEKIFIYFGF